MVNSDTACECLVTSELSRTLLSQHHTIPWPVGQDYASFSHADNGDMELLVALLFFSLSFYVSIYLSDTHIHMVACAHMYVHETCPVFLPFRNDTIHTVVAAESCVC